MRRQLTGFCGSQRACTGNKTSFPVDNSNRCYCDEACFKIFSDCCPDYERHCGPQQPLDLSQVQSKWECVEFTWSPVTPCKIEGVTGVWMITKCPASFLDINMKTRCENVSSNFSYPAENSIPVVGKSGETFRNRYCALCNGEDNYTQWDVSIFTYVIPPEDLDLDSKLRFIENNGGRIEYVSPSGEQPRRFCLGKNYIDNCSSTDEGSRKACIEGPVEVVTSTLVKYTYFKNSACAHCNGYRMVTEWETGQVCDPILPEGFSIVYKLKRDVPVTNIVRKYCPPGAVYDTNLKFCREGYINSSTGELTDEYLLLLWFYQLRRETQRNTQLEFNLKSALSSHYLISKNQISTMNFHKQDQLNNLLVASFRLTLTPFQTLIMANQNETSLNATEKNTAFLKLLDFKAENVTLNWNNFSYSVVKVISKRLSCYGKETFQSNEYKINKENETLIISKTGKIFLLKDYTFFKEKDGNITLCRNLFLSDCVDGAYVPLQQDEYEIFPNLTIYYNQAVFHFGEYLIQEILSKGQNQTYNAILSNNVTIFVCLPFSNTYHKNETHYSTTKTSDGIRILTLVCFIISIICLAMLLITYGLFQELRTVPGLNLMNLSFSMLVSHLIWLIGTSIFIETQTCNVLAVLQHYFFQVSFVAMSVISFHSYRIFAQPILGRITNRSLRTFVKYSVIVWLNPAIFVAICVALDQTGTLVVDYGTSCWLGMKHAKLYLFLLPLGVILVCTIYTFIRTAISLSQHEKNRATLHLKEGKQNLIICIKLATLVGFPWLFVFFGVFFPNVEALEYLFVIFVCLQGLYVGLAFLFNKKTLKLYKDRFHFSLPTSTTSMNTAQTFQMTS